MAGKYNKHKQDGNHLGFPIRMILATVDLQVTTILPMNFVSIGLSVQEKKFKMATIASIWDFLSQRFHLFLIYKSPRCFLSSFESNGLSVQKKKGKRFSRWPPSWISDQNDFSYFYIYKSSRCFLPIFKSTGPLVQENKQKKRVSRWPLWQPSWFSDQNNWSYFRSTSHLNASY